MVGLKLLSIRVNSCATTNMSMKMAWRIMRTKPASGESWLGGPVILSWEDAAAAEPDAGYNVVIHEFAHKLDMLNGDANGFPPLACGHEPGSMERSIQ